MITKYKINQQYQKTLCLKNEAFDMWRYRVKFNSQTILSVGSTMLLNMRLRQLGLRHVDVGGEGDCFFRAVSHQLYGDPNHHLLISAASWCSIP